MKVRSKILAGALVLYRLRPDQEKHSLVTDSAVDELPRKAALRYANAESARRMLVTAIALKRYQSRNGKYPEDLKTLCPAFLSAVPLDLMDGKPLRYACRTKGTFLLYSVGEDGVDNGGDPTPTESAATRSKQWLKARDAVWPRAARREEIEVYWSANGGEKMTDSQ